MLKTKSGDIILSTNFTNLQYFYSTDYIYMREGSRHEKGPERQKRKSPVSENIVKNHPKGNSGFLKRNLLRGSLALILGTGAVAGYERFTGGEGEEEETPKIILDDYPKPTPNPAFAEISPKREIEKVEPVAAIKLILTEYNSWLDNLNVDDIPNIDGIAKFVEIYNQYIKYLKTDKPLAQLSLKEFNKTGNPDKFFQQLEPIKKLLEKNGYYFRATPTLGQWKGEELNFMMVLTGKIQSQEQKTIERRGKKAKYQHIIVVIPPGETEENYRSAPSWATALTYNENGGTTVMQNEAGYAKSAEIIYSTLKRNPQTLKEQAVHAAFSCYDKGDRASTTQAIKEVLMSTSLSHEEQHVLDGHGEDTLMTQETMPKYMIIELRGILAPLTGPNPRAALENIFNWSIAQEATRRSIGEMTLAVLKDLAMKEPIKIFSENDDQIRLLGEKALQISDLYFHRVIEQNKPITDVESENEYGDLLDKLKDKL